MYHSFFNRCNCVINVIKIKLDLIIDVLISMSLFNMYYTFYIYNFLYKGSFYTLLFLKSKCNLRTY